LTLYAVFFSPLQAHHRAVEVNVVWRGRWQDLLGLCWSLLCQPNLVRFNMLLAFISLQWTACHEERLRICTSWWL